MPAVRRRQTSISVFQPKLRRDSTTPGYSYCAVHKSYYNRFSEQGVGAPEAHPNLIAKKGVSRVNRSQRVPKASREMIDEPEESALTAEFIELIMTVIEIHIKKLLPEEYSRIEVYASRLPLNERSPAYPFGGYVINFRGCTEGHQDDIDDEMCVVISWCPPGKSVGGEIALFEEGLVIRTRQWDAVIFHSCDSTHFNLHVKGTRISIVLQSDKHGKKWVENKNNWTQSSDPFLDAIATAVEASLST
ncbi:hypothetical protein R3P38DRAFT_3319350 [Favolaschia claudopus]|uniref:Uncharacterized protein n=1 Tax=Favolaschia claudopus TaxID=2862362 RepID=A0AAW0B1N9_9AGAR